LFIDSIHCFEEMCFDPTNGGIERQIANDLLMKLSAALYGSSDGVGRRMGLSTY
jgi:hypothetical protein